MSVPNQAVKTVETPEQVIARLQAQLSSAQANAEQANRRVAELEAAKASINVTWKFADYGKGAIAIYGIAGRMPVSLYPATLTAFIEKYGQDLLAHASNPAVIDESRARGYAYEGADKAFKAATNRDFIHDERGSTIKRLDGDLAAWQKLYDAHFAQAMADKSLMSKALAKRNSK